VDDVNIGHFTTEYPYDSLGRRIEKRHADGTATRYVYDGSRVAEEWDVSSGGSASLSASYVYGNYIDEVLTMRRGTSDYYYHGDDQHNVVKLTDNTGAVVESYDYGDYGQPEFYDASGALLDVSESPFGNPYLFTGRRWDEELGYYYFRNRYMDPALGRFVSRDPIGLWGDAANLGNGYTYAASNPWSLVDPLGLKSGGNIEPDDGPRNGDTLAMDSQQYGIHMPEGPDSRYAPDEARALAQQFHGTLWDQVKWTANGMAFLPGPMGTVGDAVLAYQSGNVWMLVPVVGGEVVGKARILSKTEFATELRKTYCFAAGTPVLTVDGLVPIEDVEVGDLVYSRDDETGEESYQEVLHTFVTPDMAVWDVELSTDNGTTEVITATYGHPFWVEGSGWTDTENLEVGMELSTSNESVVKVSGLKLLQDIHTVYNLEVANNHTYFVGNASIWVHNIGRCDLANAEGRRQAAKNIGNGHAYKDHRKDFPKSIGGNRESFIGHAEELMEKGGHDLYVELNYGRAAFYRKSDNTLLIFDPSHKDNGTMFMPKKGEDAFWDLDTR